MSNFDNDEYFIEHQLYRDVSMLLQKPEYETISAMGVVGVLSWISGEIIRDAPKDDEGSDYR